MHLRCVFVSQCFLVFILGWILGDVPNLALQLWPLLKSSSMGSMFHLTLPFLFTAELASGELYFVTRSENNPPPCVKAPFFNICFIE